MLRLSLSDCGLCLLTFLSLLGRLSKLIFSNDFFSLNFRISDFIQAWTFPSLHRPVSVSLQGGSRFKNVSTYAVIYVNICSYVLNKDYCFVTFLMICDIFQMTYLFMQLFPSPVHFQKCNLVKATTVVLMYSKHYHVTSQLQQEVESWKMSFDNAHNISSYSTQHRQQYKFSLVWVLSLCFTAPGGCVLEHA